MAKKVKEAKVQLTWKEVKRQKFLLISSALFVIYGFLFYYMPLGGWLMAFQNYKPKDGLLGSTFVGLAKFKFLFTDATFLKVMRNTLCMGVLNLVTSFILAIVFACMIPFVTVNTDNTKYLAADSDMRKGLDIINSEFPAADLKDSFQIMFQNLTETQKIKILEELKEFEGVSSIDYDLESSEYNTKTYTMYMVNTDYSGDPDKVGAVVDSMEKHFKDKYTVYTYYSGGYMDVLDILLPMALSIMLVLLFLLCRSYLEPALLLISIGVAVLINMGSNIMFESVSDITFGIAAVMQLVLSVDYSIMLLHRYEQEYDLLGRKHRKQAMARAILNSISSIWSSALTTVVGLLVLLLMSFTIGRDIGLVLAKGVLLSFITVFTVMPTLIIKFSDLLYKTKKDYIKQQKLVRDGGEDDV